MLKDKKAKQAAMAEANRLLRLALRNDVALHGTRTTASATDANSICPPINDHNSRQQKQKREARPPTFRERPTETADSREKRAVEFLLEQQVPAAFTTGDTVT